MVCFVSDTIVEMILGGHEQLRKNCGNPGPGSLRIRTCKLVLERKTKLHPMYLDTLQANFDL